MISENASSWYVMVTSGSPSEPPIHAERVAKSARERQQLF